jgi:hypothetical protein
MVQVARHARGNSPTRASHASDQAAAAQEGLPRRYRYHLRVRLHLSTPAAILTPSCSVCWMLTPTQIQSTSPSLSSPTSSTDDPTFTELIANYYVADYENTLSPEILRAVNSRVIAGDKNDHLLLPPEVEEAGPYEVPLPREVTGIEVSLSVSVFVVESVLTRPRSTRLSFRAGFVLPSLHLRLSLTGPSPQLNAPHIRALVRPPLPSILDRLDTDDLRSRRFNSFPSRSELLFVFTVRAEEEEEEGEARERCTLHFIRPIRRSSSSPSALPLACLTVSRYAMVCRENTLNCIVSRYSLSRASLNLKLQAWC